MFRSIKELIRTMLLSHLDSKHFFLFFQIFWLKFVHSVADLSRLFCCCYYKLSNILGWPHTCAFERVLLPVSTFNRKAKIDSSVCVCVCVIEYVMSDDECGSIECVRVVSGVRMKEKGAEL